MSRVIRFRAWDKINKWLDDEFYLGSDGSVYDIPNKTYNTPNTEIERIDNFILMQYTGLKDKNGVEIFEGDICRYKNDGSYWVGMVRYNHCSYMFSSDRGQNLIYTLDREVIGNIHEDPELLK